MEHNSIKQHPAFQPLRIKNRLLQNRYAVAPMSRVSSTIDGVPTDVMTSYYSAFGEGGFSFIITEGIYTDNLYSRGYERQPGLVTPQQAEKWSHIVTATKKQGSLIIAQLMHAGALSQYLQITKAPSAIRPAGAKMPEYGGAGPFPAADELSVAEINNVIEGFRKAAVNAVDAGFDGVEIHAANGYLLDQFLTDYTNLRDDEYGGAFSNRYRIIATIIRHIRVSVPENFIIGLRLSEGKVNNMRYRWPGQSQTARELLAVVNTALPDYIHVAADSGNWQRDCTYPDGTSFTGLAKAITGVPVIANGGLHDLRMSDTVISTGQADIIALGTAALADPAWPKKTLQGMSSVPFTPTFIKPSASIYHERKVKSSLLAEVG